MTALKILTDRLKVAAEAAVARQNATKPHQRAMVALTGEELRQVTEAASKSTKEPKPACLAVQANSATQVSPEDTCYILAEDALALVELAVDAAPVA